MPKKQSTFLPLIHPCRREFKGQHDRGNVIESLCEGNLPLRGSLTGRFSEFFQGLLEVFRGFQRISEVLRGFQRFSQIFQSRDPLRGRFPSQRPSVQLPLGISPTLSLPSSTKLTQTEKIDLGNSFLYNFANRRRKNISADNFNIFRHACRNHTEITRTHSEGGEALRL